MATQLRGSTQIKDLSIPNVKLEDATLEFAKFNTNSYTDDLAVSASNVEFARADAIKNYVDSLVDGSLKAPEAYDPSVTGDYPLTYGGEAIQKGDSFRMTAAQVDIGWDGVRDVNVEDLLIALIDGADANTSSDWMVAESNRNQATEAEAWVAKIATQVITDAGVNDTDFVTPLKLDTYLVNKNISDDWTKTVGTYWELLSPTSALVKELRVFNNDEWLTQLYIKNTDDVNTYSWSWISLEWSWPEYTNYASLFKYGAWYYIPSWAGNAVLASDKDLIISTENVIKFQAWWTSVAPKDVFEIELDGTLVSKTTSYENLVLSANDIPNKRYVDTAISKLVHNSNELPTVTDGSTNVGALANLGTHPTEKVTNVEVYKNWLKQTPWAWNDYVINSLIGVIVFSSALSGTDLINVDYDTQNV